MKETLQRVGPILGITLLILTMGCQKSAQQQTGNETEAQDQAATEPSATTEPSSPADEGQSDLAQREAEVAQRERDVARREAQLSGSGKTTSGESPRPSTTQVESASGTANGGTESAANDQSWRERRAERTETFTVPAGTTFDIELVDGLSSESAKPGDHFTAHTVDDLRADGGVAVPAGSTVEGVVSDVQSLKKIGGQARLALRFDRIVLADGTSFPLDASFAAAGKSETGRDAGTIAGSTAAGAILGRIVDKKHRGKSTVLGALVGAAVGTAIASKTKGEEVNLPSGAVVTLSLDQSLTVTRRVPAG